MKTTQKNNIRKLKNQLIDDNIIKDKMMNKILTVLEEYEDERRKQNQLLGKLKYLKENGNEIDDCYMIDSKERLNHLFNFIEKNYDDKIHRLIGNISHNYTTKGINNYSTISYDSIEYGILTYLRDKVCVECIENDEL